MSELFHSDRHRVKSNAFLFAALAYFLVLLGLFFYSFTQVDLNLTLSRIDLVSGFQNFFQYTGYFQRAYSTFLYMVILGGLTFTYTMLLFLVKKQLLLAKHVWFLVGLTVIVLFFSYPAFSYDIFNYMFDARIVTKYSEDPYIHKALDYPNDPWISFMRWTHRTYPYGPAWLWLTVPFSFIGSGYFVLTLFLFKLIMSISYVGAVYFVWKILKKINPQHTLFGVAFFAFNPLVIVESLVSGHNDIVMMAFAIAAFYFLIVNKWIYSYIFLGLSIGIKFATGFVAPIFLLYPLRKYLKLKFSEEVYPYAMIILMVGAVVAASYRTQFQPWYLVFVLPFAAIVAKKAYILIPATICSIGALALYIPYIFTGNWDPPIPDILVYMEAFLVGLSLVSASLYYAFRKRVT